MTPLQQLTTLIYASIPELLTLGVGCEFQAKNTTFKFEIIKEIATRYYALNVINQSVEFTHYEIVNQYEIIGKPPTLVDVLKWLLDELNYSINDTQIQNIILMWTASKSIYLRDQSPELINFLLELKK